MDTGLAPVGLMSSAQESICKVHRLADSTGCHTRNADVWWETGKVGICYQLFQCLNKSLYPQRWIIRWDGEGGEKIDLGDGSLDCWCVHSCAGTMWVLTHGHPIKGLYMKLSCWSDRRFCAVSAHFIKIPAEIQLWNPTVCVSW